MAEETGVAKGDNTMARRCRWGALVSGMAYLLLPQGYIFLGYFAAFNTFLHNMLFAIIQYGSLFLGLACLWFITASLFLSRPRNWRGVDRVVGILLVISGAIVTVHVVLTPSSNAFFTESTQHLLLARTFLFLILLLTAGLLFLVRYSWAWWPTLALVCLSFFRIEPDNPEFLKQIEQANLKSVTPPTVAGAGTDNESDSVVVIHETVEVIRSGGLVEQVLVLVYAIVRSVMAFRERTKNKLVAADSGGT